jgi:hypothetical protein
VFSSSPHSLDPLSLGRWTVGSLGVDMIYL